ncbi:MAG: DUF4097 domain-containing protein [Actinomycetota bacterium]|nr:DUF4097 domain-containing protein [Actinomycetota bacterium]
MSDMTANARAPGAHAIQPRVPSRTVGARLWRFFGALFAIGLLTGGTFQVVELLAHDEYTTVDSYPAVGISVLDVRSAGGSVTVVGRDDVDTIEVTARVSDGLRSTGNRQEVVGDRLELRGSCPNYGNHWCRVSYTVVTPSDTIVRASADDGTLIASDLAAGADLDNDNGRIEARNIDGPLEVTNDNGGIQINDVTGSLTVDNDHGDIVATGVDTQSITATNDHGDVTVSLVNPPQRVRANSDHGDVEVVLPNTQDDYRTDLTTDDGDVVTAIRTNPDSQRSVVLETDHGDVTVRYGP